jgi:hypothetical protein
MNKLEEKIKANKVVTSKRHKVLNYFSGLKFNAEHHIYTHKNKNLSSASGVIKKFTEPFEADKIAGFVARSRGISKQAVLQEWEDKKNAACDKGNRVHDFGENHGNYLSGRGTNVPPSDLYEEAVLKFWDSIPDHIHPFHMELQMFSEKLGIAGTADIILYNEKTDKFVIADYKTNIDLFKNYKGKKMLAPFNDMLDMPYSKYVIQLSIYQHLLEQAGVEVEERRIIWLQPDGTYKTYKTPDIRSKILKTFKC